MRLKFWYTSVRSDVICSGLILHLSLNEPGCFVGNGFRYQDLGARCSYDFEGTFSSGFFSIDRRRNMHALIFTFVNMSISVLTYTLISNFVYTYVFTHTQHIRILEFTSQFTLISLNPGHPCRTLAYLPRFLFVYLIHSENPVFQKYLHISFAQS